MPDLAPALPLPVATPAAVPMAAKPADTAAPLVVSLITLAEVWPDTVRRELVLLNLVDAQVALPFEVVERTLRRGRMVFRTTRRSSCH
jgi:hypothetical protein